MKHEYKPVILNPADDKDRDQLNSIFQSRDIEIVDTFNSQLIELYLCRNTLLNSENAILDTHLTNQLTQLDEYSGLMRWIFYPWKNQIISTLTENEFVEVRTNRNQHKITKDEQTELRKKTVGIVGLSVGSSIALCLALERLCGHMKLIDGDTIELSNLNRLHASLSSLGVPKVVNVARQIAEFDPYLKVDIINSFLDENNIENFFFDKSKIDLLIDECDDLRIKWYMRLIALKFKIPVIMETNDRGQIDIERYDLDDDLNVFHGRLQNLDYYDMDFTDGNTYRFLLSKILDIEMGSERAKYSLSEIGKSIRSWPQLGSSVLLGAGVSGDVVRRILLNKLKGSGRFFIDLEKLIQ